MESTIISEGMAVCILEPRGESGLEGYTKGDEYHFEKMKTERGAEYYRVYPNPNSDYYEMCGAYKFVHFFDEVE